MGSSLWTRGRAAIGRRAVLEGVGVGALGLAGAALLGCGGSGDQAASTGGAGGSGATGGTGATGGADAAAASGAPKNVTRGGGWKPGFGEVPINTKKVIMGGTYIRSDSGTTRQQDPDVSIAGSNAELILDRLTNANGWTMDISPDMLTSFERVDKAGLEFVLKLRSGIKTHDRPPVNGRIFTAKDVAYSIMRKAGHIDPAAAAKYARRQQFDGLEKAEAVDDTTIKLTLSKPNGSLMQALSDPRAQVMPIEMDTVGWKDPLKMVGTGAWMQTEHVEGSRHGFTRFPDYYREWDEGGRPAFDKYEMIAIADRASIMAAYLSNQIGEFPGIRPEEEDQIASGAKDTQVYLFPGPTWDHFALNMTLPDQKWNDGRVRKALMYALDYQALADPLGAGWTYSTVTHNQFPESLQSDEVAKLPGYNKDTKDKDIAEAKKLMAAAGHENGAGLVWDQVNSGATVNDSNVRIKEQLEKVWPQFQIKLKSLSDYASATNVLNERAFEARAWNHTSVPDAAIDAATYWHTDGGRNYQGWSFPWSDQIIDKLIVAQTREERTDLVHQLANRVLEEGPALMLLRTPAENRAVHGNVGGYDLISGTWAYASYRIALKYLWQTEK